MTDIQQQIKEALKKCNTDYYTPNESDIEISYKAREWLTHQQQIIEQQAILIQQLRGALGYPVPWHIIENPDIINGIAEAMSQQLEQQAAEIEKLKFDDEERHALHLEIERQAVEIAKAKSEIEFQVKRNDEQREIYFKMEKQVLDQTAKIKVLECDNDMLEEIVSEQAAKIERAKEIGKHLKSYRLGIESKLEIAVKALEHYAKWIVWEVDSMGNTARQALVEIQGDEQL